MRIRCNNCGKPVSTEVPHDTIIRGWVECPECIEKQINEQEELSKEQGENMEYMNKKLYVNWPTGRGGPYEYNMFQDSYEVHLDKYTIIVPPAFVELHEPTLDDERWYFAWDKHSITSDFAGKGDTIDIDAWDYISPVYVKWHELDKDEQQEFADFLKSNPNPEVGDIYDRAIKITSRNRDGDRLK